MIKAYEFYGVEIPQKLIPPDLHDIEYTLWRDFQELSTERMSGMGKAPIPWSAIERYHAVNGGIEAAKFRQIIRAMDGVYLAHKPEE